MTWKEKVDKLKPKQHAAVEIDITEAAFRNYMAAIKKQTGWTMWYRKIEDKLFVVTRWE